MWEWVSYSKKPKKQTNVSCEKELIMNPAPAFDCAKCGRRIGQARTHCLVAFADGVWCVTCVEAADDYANGFDAYEDIKLCTRAAAARLLGLWP
jgi:hypothetical protein